MYASVPPEAANQPCRTQERKIGHKELRKTLTLARRRGEQLVLDGRIIVAVLEARGANVKLGIEGPPEAPVHRKGVFQAVSESGVPSCGGQPHVRGSADALRRRT